MIGAVALGCGYFLTGGVASARDFPSLAATAADVARLIQKLDGSKNPVRIGVGGAERIILMAGGASSSAL